MVPSSTSSTKLMIVINDFPSGNHRIVNELITYPVPPSHSFGFYKCFAKTLQGVRGFEGPEPPVSLHGPAVNISLLQTLMFWAYKLALTLKRICKNMNNLSEIRLKEILMLAILLIIKEKLVISS